MALSALSARLGVGASRMIVMAVGGGGTGKANSFSRTLKVVSDSNGGVGRRGFGQIRRFSAGAMARLPEQITKDPSQQGVCYLAAYCAGLALCCGAPFGLKYIADRYAERRKPRYGEFKDDVRQFGDEYFGDQWPGADDRKLAELGKEIALLGGALNRWNRGIGEAGVIPSRKSPGCANSPSTLEPPTKCSRSARSAIMWWRKRLLNSPSGGRRPMKSWLNSTGRSRRCSGRLGRKTNSKLFFQVEELNVHGVQNGWW